MNNNRNNKHINKERGEVIRLLLESRESVWDYKKQLNDAGINVFCNDQADVT